MITAPSYFGDQVDVWSIGCILLELIFGHEKFCEFWMAAYDYEIIQVVHLDRKMFLRVTSCFSSFLQAKDKFSAAISSSVAKLPAFLCFSDDLNDFVMKFLQLRPSDRDPVDALLAHPWFRDIAPSARFRSESIDAASRIDNGSSPLTPLRLITTSSCGDMSTSTRDDSFSPRTGAEMQSNFIRAELLKATYSERERKMIEDYNNVRLQDSESDQSGSVYHLPPIEPMTPSLNDARKILQKGVSLVKQFESPYASPKLVNKMDILYEKTDDVDAIAPR